MFFQGPREYQDVIDECNHEFVKIRPQYLIDQMHEGCWCIGEPEGQHQELEVTVASPECCLLNVRFMDADLMISGFEIDLGEVPSTLQSIKQLIDSWQRVLVLDGDL